MTRRSSPASGPAQGKFTVELPCNFLQTIDFDTPRRQFDGERVAAELATDIAGDPDVLIRQIDRPAARRRALHEEFTAGNPSNSAAVRLEPSGGLSRGESRYTFSSPTRRVSRLVTSR